MSEQSVHRPVFETRFDVVVVGAGHAGVAAALHLADQGRDVLLIDRRGDVMVESGRGFAARSGHADDDVWSRVSDGVARLGGRADDWLDGALTEIVGTDLLVEAGVSTLFYVQPIALDLDAEGLVCGIALATRTGVRRIHADRVIDATESGELVSLASDTTGRTPSTSRIQLLLQHPDWTALPEPEGSRATAWPSERSVSVEFDGSSWNLAVRARLDQLARELGDAISDVCLSHLGLVPSHEYRGLAPRPALPGNLVAASPAYTDALVSTPADRHRLGIEAARALATASKADRISTSPETTWRPRRVVRGDLCVAGIGTGGVLAAVAAARSGASVVAIEAGDILGGVGTTGGIHVYWFGAPGGLQAELDDRTHTLMNDYGRGPLGDGPFNPWAKLLAIEEMLDEEDIVIFRGALVFDVERVGRQIVAVHAATSDGVVRFEAMGFVDATGDGDLCALAGSGFALGRESDGLLHAYSQSSGRLRLLHGSPRMDHVNFDAGFCDPTDPEDLTRARLDGVRGYLVDGGFPEIGRPTYIAPALGIRQGRLVETDYVLTLDDLVSRRRFSDAVGYTAAHFDNHATDMEFESDDAVLYQWVLEQSSTPIACELPYRVLLPTDLDNVWIGSRSLGLSQDAQYVTRMQRDIQRVGEVAGLAGALAVRDRVDARAVPIRELQSLLRKSSALSRRPRSLETGFGLYTRTDDAGHVEFRSDQATSTEVLGELGDDRLDDHRDAAAAALARGLPDASLWWASRHPERTRDLMLMRLQDPTSNESTTWFAAAVLAVWGDPAAEPRLVAALRTLEYAPSATRRRTEQSGSEAGPGASTRAAPRWLVALVLLRACGGAATVDALDGLRRHAGHSLTTLSAACLTIARLAPRLDARDRSRCVAILDWIESVESVESADYAARNVGLHSHTAAVAGSMGPDHVTAHALAEPQATQFRRTYQDRSWQRDLALARARRALGVGKAAPDRYAADRRGFVRRAFERLRTP